MAFVATTRTGFQDIQKIVKEAYGDKALKHTQIYEGVRYFLTKVCHCSMAMLDNIVTMDVSAILFHTPEAKGQSKQWLPKGQPGPVKAKLHGTRTKQMVLAFFYSMGLIYIGPMPMGTIVNASCIVAAQADSRRS